MKTTESKKLAQVVGALCALIGSGTSGRGFAFCLAILAKTPEAVENVAAAAKAIIEKMGTEES